MTPPAPLDIEFRRNVARARLEAYEGGQLVGWIDDIELAVQPRLVDVWKLYMRSNETQRTVLDSYLSVFR